LAANYQVPEWFQDGKIGVWMHWGKDPASGDFSFRPNSPALKLGIEPLDVSKMGRRDMGRGVNNSDL